MAQLPTNSVYLETVNDFLGWMRRFLRSSKPRPIDRAIDPYGFKKSLSTVKQDYDSYLWDEDRGVKPLERRRQNHRFSLEEAIQNGNLEQYADVCSQREEWGGIKNSPSPPPFNVVSKQLKYLEKANWRALFNRDLFPYMSSYHSKIYWALSNELVIYDARTASALTSFIHQYSREKSISLPEELKLSVPQRNYAKNGNHNPDPNTFPLLYSGVNSPGQYAKSIIYASWILNALSTTAGTPFSTLQNPLLSLQSAMFMLGQPDRAMTCNEF